MRNCCLCRPKILRRPKKLPGVWLALEALVLAASGFALHQTLGLAEPLFELLRLEFGLVASGLVSTCDLHEKLSRNDNAPVSNTSSGVLSRQSGTICFAKGLSGTPAQEV